MTILAQLNDCHSCNDARSIVQKKHYYWKKINRKKTKLHTEPTNTKRSAQVLELDCFFFEIMPCALQGSDSYLNVCGPTKRRSSIGPRQMLCKKYGCIHLLSVVLLIAIELSKSPSSKLPKMASDPRRTLS